VQPGTGQARKRFAAPACEAGASYRRAKFAPPAW
jgi:hypothetical protein